LIGGFRVFKISEGVCRVVCQTGRQRLPPYINFALTVERALIDI